MDTVLFIVVIQMFVPILMEDDKHFCNKETKCTADKTVSRPDIHLRHVHNFSLQGIECINLDYNHFKDFDKDDWNTFTTSLKCLHVNNCKIKSFPDDEIFKILLNFTELGISYNDFTRDDLNRLLGAVQKSHIKILYISGYDFSETDLTITFSKLRLTHLYMNDCHLKSLDNLFHSNTTYQLSELQLHGNFITEKSLTIFYNYSWMFPYLMLLKLSRNPIKLTSSEMFSLLRNIQSLWLDNLTSKLVTFPGIISSTLRDLDISNSFMLQPVDKCKDVFQLSKNLIALNLTGTDLSNWSESDLIQLFSPLSSLSSLILSKTALSKIPENLFNNIEYLKILDLSRNSIHNWTTSCFANMSRNFTDLYLNDNNISTINKTSFPDNLLLQLRKLHLYGNTFKCDCFIHWFRNWMKLNYHKLEAFSIDHSHFTYRCHYPVILYNTLLVDYDPDYESCHGLLFVEVIALCIVIFCFAVIITLNMTLMICKFRQRKTAKGDEHDEL